MIAQPIVTVSLIYTYKDAPRIMNDITEDELLRTIEENPMICTRAIVKKLRPEEFKDNATYLEYVKEVKPILMKLWKDGKIVSSKVQCCTFNLKQWQIA